MILIPILLLGWILCGVAAGMIGAEKGAGCFGFIVGFLFGPLGILFAFLDTGNRQSCPFCREKIHRDAIRCPRCQGDLAAMFQTVEPDPKSEPGDQQKTLQSSEPQDAIRVALGMILILGLAVGVALFLARTSKTAGGSDASGPTDSQVASPRVDTAPTIRR